MINLFLPSPGVVRQQSEDREAASRSDVYLAVSDGRHREFDAGPDAVPKARLNAVVELQRQVSGVVGMEHGSLPLVECNGPDDAV